MNTNQFYTLDTRIINGAFIVREILVVEAMVFCKKLPCPQLVSCKALYADEIEGPILFNGKNDSTSIPTDNLTVVPAGTHIISPSKNPSFTP